MGLDLHPQLLPLNIGTKPAKREKEITKRGREREREKIWFVCGLSELGWVNNHAIS